MGRILLVLLAVLLTACARPAGRGADPDELVIRVIPTQAKAKLGAAFARLVAHLERDLGRPVRVEVALDYAAVVEAMKAGKGDIAFLGPYSYVVANAQSGARAFLTQQIGGSPYYHSYMIVPKESPLAQGVTDLTALGGRKVAFGDPASTSSSLIPRLALQKAGLDWQQDIRAVFTGGHDAVLAAVAYGQADAGFLDSALFEFSLAGKVPEQFDRVAVAWRSQPLYQYPWAARAGLDPSLVERVRASMLAITDPEILDAFGASGFVPAEDADYDDVREAARAMGTDLRRPGGGR